ncbi:P-loop containing nucleoside triphosphate hydrolase protein [Rhodotorula diobovata]|uniref:P-loop containing nucleoside triphosphate hydrolase protein n=1 Tax=Rhodotorula diobovata TaxID=5288 RepID=A0A5C5FT98_9BASI|nr:P-loop containing nucleoside triphosphate hydrolase protein [Rhodotorula diobovata]
MPPPVPPFHFPALLPQSWYIGHMHRAMREITHLVQSHSLDLIIETRDARLPLTSINPAFERLLAEQAGRSFGAGPGGSGGTAKTKRLIVYNKADLAQDCFQEPLRRAMAKHSDDEVLFTDSRSDAEVRRLLRAAIRMARRPLEGPDDKISMLVAGMPNVGKSSILNALRRVGVKKGKAASTSSEPGHTRRLSTVIKIATSPPVYIYDTPGIMVPFLGRGVAGQEAALKLALTGGIKESLFEREVLGEYLLWRLRIRGEMRDDGWRDSDLFERLSLPPSTPLSDPDAFFTALAGRLSAVRRGGTPDVDFAGRWLVQAFREGKLGRWTLDGLGRGGEAVDDAREMREIEVGEGEAKELLWERTERRWGYLSREEPAPAPAPEGAVSATPANDAGDAASAPSPPLVEERTPPAPPAAASPAASSPLDAPVSTSVATHLSHLSLLASSLDLQSSHQSKKATKADQARVRELKRRGHEVAKAPRRFNGGGARGGAPGAGGKGPRGPVGKLVSARRRKFRRSG